MSASAKPKRIRRTATEAKNMILDAAEKRLREFGPGGIKLQELAADVGVSHPAILHHFGSRDGLVEAVVRRALDTLRTAVLEEVRQQMRREVDIPSILDSVFGILAERGHARLVAWLILEGERRGTIPGSCAASRRRPRSAWFREAGPRGGTSTSKTCCSR